MGMIYGMIMVGEILSRPLVRIALFLAVDALLLRKRMQNEQMQCMEMNSDSGMTGSFAAEIILSEEGMYDVQVKRMDAKRGDYYDPLEKTIYLCEETYSGASIYALACAAHQCGHAWQHKVDYCSMTVRTILSAVLSIISFCGLPLMIWGIYDDYNLNTIQLAVGMMAALTFFQLLGMRIEFHASDRAMVSLLKFDLIPSYEMEYLKKALDAAAITYLSSGIVSVNIIWRYCFKRQQSG